MPNMEKNAYVRMRGDEWTLAPKIAAILEQRGVIARDYDCEQNTIDNGFAGEGPCYAVNGEPESDEEIWNASLLDKWEDGPRCRGYLTQEDDICPMHGTNTKACYKYSDKQSGWS